MRRSAETAGRLPVMTMSPVLLSTRPLKEPHVWSAAFTATLVSVSSWLSKITHRQTSRTGSIGDMKSGIYGDTLPM